MGCTGIGSGGSVTIPFMVDRYEKKACTCGDTHLCPDVFVVREPVNEWLKECTRPADSPSSWLSSTEAYEHFLQWCSLNEEPPVGIGRFSFMLKLYKIPRKKASVIRWGIMFV